MDWLERFDTWFKISAGIPDQCNLHLLYDRTLTVIGAGLLRAVPSLLAIGTLASNIGFSFCAQVELQDALGRRDKLDELLAARVVKAMFLDARTISDDVPRLQCLELVEYLIRAEVSPVPMGPVAFWTSTGVLASPVLNGINFQLLPSRPHSQISQMSTAHLAGQSVVSLIKGADEAAEFNPCANRMEIIISSDGLIYPCRGTIGVAGCALGKLSDSIEDTALGEAAYPLDIARLFRVGPQLPTGQTVSHDLQIPAVCARHRQQLESAS